MGKQAGLPLPDVYTIYSITDRRGKVYVGGTSDYGVRHWHWVNGPWTGEIGRAIESEGVEHFKFQVLATGVPGRDMAEVVEGAFIDALGSLAPAGYNFDRGGHGLCKKGDVQYARQVERGEPVSEEWAPPHKRYDSTGRRLPPGSKDIGVNEDA